MTDRIVWTGVQIETFARAIAHANLMYSIGQGGVAVMNQKLIEQTFEKAWRGSEPQDKAIRDAARWIAQTVLKDPNVMHALKG